MDFISRVITQDEKTRALDEFVGCNCCPLSEWLIVYRPWDSMWETAANTLLPGKIIREMFSIPVDIYNVWQATIHSIYERL